MVRTPQDFSGPLFEEAIRFYDSYGTLPSEVGTIVYSDGYFYFKDIKGNYKLRTVESHKNTHLGNGLDSIYVISNNNPTVNEDLLDGYEIGTRWINIVDGYEFVLLNNTVGSAMWSSTGGGNNNSTVLDDDQVYTFVDECDSFTVKENFQHILFEHFTINGEYIVEGESIILSSNDASSSVELHSSTHENDGYDEINVAGLSGELADAQKITVRKNTGTNVGSKSRLNFIEGSNVNLSITDDLIDNEIDITISASLIGGSGDVVGPSSSTDNAISRFDGITGKLIQNSLCTIDDVGALRSVKYVMGNGPDLSLLPVVGGQSVITTWWAMQLVGNQQSNVDYTPVNVGARDQFGVVVPTKRNSDASFAIVRLTAQTGDLFRVVDESLNPLVKITASGNILFNNNQTVDGRDLSVDGYKLDGVESGAQVNNISNTNVTDLTDGGDSSLHYHSSDRNRANHTGTQSKSTISDFSHALDSISHGALSDITTFDATISAHGFLPKLGGGTSNFLRADGTWNVPATVSHASSHKGGGSDVIDSATVSVAGLMSSSDKTKLDGIATGADVTGSNAPQAHATSHASGGSDSIKLDDLAVPDDNTDLNATTSAHGLLPKLGGGTSNFLRADGTWAAPSGAPSLIVFSGYDEVGGTTVGTTWVDVPINAEYKKTSGFTHSTTVSPAEITITSSGTYKITCDITIDISSGTARSESILRLMGDSGSGFVEISGTRAVIYNRTLNNGASTSSINIILDLTDGYILKAQASRSNGSSTLVLVANGSRFTIHKID
jgi:hypothetical protein